MDRTWIPGLGEAMARLGQAIGERVAKASPDCVVFWGTLLMATAGFLLPYG